MWITALLCNLLLSVKVITNVVLEEAARVESGGVVNTNSSALLPSMVTPVIERGTLPLFLMVIIFDEPVPTPLLSKSRVLLPLVKRIPVGSSATSLGMYGMATIPRLWEEFLELVADMKYSPINN